MTDKPHDAAPRQQLSLLDSTCIIVGIIIGASIYESSPFIAQNASAAAVKMVESCREWSQLEPLSPDGQATVSQLAIVGVWLLGGVLALIGAIVSFAMTRHTLGEEAPVAVGMARATG